LALDTWRTVDFVADDRFIVPDIGRGRDEDPVFFGVLRLGVQTAVTKAVVTLPESVRLPEFRLAEANEIGVVVAARDLDES
jgi:hypothetical protein